MSSLQKSTFFALTLSLLTKSITALPRAQAEYGYASTTEAIPSYSTVILSSSAVGYSSVASFSMEDSSSSAPVPYGYSTADVSSPYSSVYVPSSTEVTIFPTPTSYALPSSYEIPTSLDSSVLVSSIPSSYVGPSSYGASGLISASASSVSAPSSYGQYIPSSSIVASNTTRVVPSSSDIYVTSSMPTSSSIAQHLYSTTASVSVSSSTTNSSYISGSPNTYIIPSSTLVHYNSSSYVAPTGPASYPTIPTSIISTRYYSNSSYSVPISTISSVSTAPVSYTTKTSITTIYGTFTKTVFVPCPPTTTVISGTTTTVYQTAVTYGMTSPISTKTLTSVVPCDTTTIISVAPYTPASTPPTSTSYSTVTKVSTIYSTVTKTSYAPCPPSPTVVAGITTTITKIPVVYTTVAPVSVITSTIVVPCDTTTLVAPQPTTYPTQASVTTKPVDTCPGATTVTETQQVTVYHTMTAPASTITVTSMGGYFNITRVPYQTYH